MTLKLGYYQKYTQGMGVSEQSRTSQEKPLKNLLLKRRKKYQKTSWHFLNTMDPSYQISTKTYRTPLLDYQPVCNYGFCFTLSSGQTFLLFLCFFNWYTYLCTIGEVKITDTLETNLNHKKKKKKKKKSLQHYN